MTPVRKSTVLLLAAILWTSLLGAQNVSDLIISEALAQPDSTGILDGYGRRSGWIELYNTSTGTVNFGGCFLTDDRGDLTKSIIPKSDNRTKLGPRQVVLIHASGNGADGTFYDGFTLEPGSSVYLVSNDGRTIIDSLCIPKDQPEGKSVIKLAGDIRQKHFVQQEEAAVPTPGILNGKQDNETRAQHMKEQDPHGWILTLVSVSVVFSALAILWFMFWLLFDRRAQKAAAAQKAAPKAVPEGEVAAAITLALDMENSGDDYAAIAAAVHLYLSETVHDAEPGMITIVRRPSAWESDKSLNFRKLPR